MINRSLGDGVDNCGWTTGSRQDGNNSRHERKLQKNIITYQAEFRKINMEMNIEEPKHWPQKT